MSDNAIPDVRAGVAEKKSPRGNSFADHPLVQLTLVRFREFMREPEALFWVFVFPILLAAGFGHCLPQSSGGGAQNRSGHAGTCSISAARKTSRSSAVRLGSCGRSVAHRESGAARCAGIPRHGRVSI